MSIHYLLGVPAILLGARSNSLVLSVLVGLLMLSLFGSLQHSNSFIAATLNTVFRWKPKFCGNFGKYFKSAFKSHKTVHWNTCQWIKTVKRTHPCYLDVEIHVRAPFYLGIAFVCVCNITQPNLIRSSVVLRRAMTDGHLFNNITLGGRGGTVSSLSLSSKP